MKNLDILILTSVVISCFIAFFISTFRTFENIQKEGVDKYQKRGIISRLLGYFESIL
ncbi:hypothetical protein [Flavobacterium sp. LB2R40]|uniref:hypothetical protein n=1 Tax=unclassified Flavobacterium TaxID=196869 RepID=UPI003AAF2D1F